MLWAVGLAAYGGAPLTSGMMCLGLLVLPKDGPCCILSKAHACSHWNTWKGHMATTTLHRTGPGGTTATKSAGTTNGCTFVARPWMFERLRLPCLPCAGPDALQPGR